jgi:hypothetical protein
MLHVDHVTELPIEDDKLLNQPVLESCPEKTVSISLPAPAALDRKKFVIIFAILSVIFF